MNFNKPDWNKIIPIICGSIGVLSEILLIIIAMEKQDISVKAFVIQCNTCIIWIVLSTVLLLFDKR